MPRPLLFLFLAFALPAQAQPADTAWVELPGVEVAAPRWQAAERTVQVDRISADVLAQTGAQSVADALEAHTSAFVRRYGPAGLATISLRGTGAGQTAVLLDGFPIANPQLGQADGALLPAEGLGRVEVLSGAGSVWHGSQAVGGVVNLVPSLPSRTPKASVTLGAAPWGERSVATRAQAGAVALALRHTSAEGDFDFVLPRADGDVRLRREGADLEQTSVLATAARGATRAGVLGAWSARGLPGPAGRPPQDERQDDASVHAYARHAAASGGGILGVGALVGASTLRYRAPGHGTDDTGTTQTAYAEATYARTASPGLQADLGPSLLHARAAHPSLAENAAETTASTWASAAWQRGRWLLAPSLRADARTDGAGAVTGRLGLAADLLPTLTARLSLAQAFRAPTLNDRFWQPGSNSDLRPERGWSLEAGARLERGPLQAEVAAYAHELRNQIVWLPEGGVWTPRNVSRTRTLGLDLSTAWTPLAGQFARAGFALTDARDQSAGSSTRGERLRFVPVAQARLHVGARLFGADVDALGRAVGRRPVTADGSEWLSGFATLDLGARRSWTTGRARLALSIRLHNALDARYRVIEGYPMPGRHVRAGLTLGLAPTS
jgi:iron complex outermembrane receptor protein